MRNLARSADCKNLNHSKMNVSIRFCPACGEVVNEQIQGRTCSREDHAKRRKERDNFCIDCGKKVT